uniref:pituitary tumor-transforming gene 1 protein-interacting protein isoform X1 n=1 Tax=Ciona intestinalis TaxID=7719 RepID=UPI0000522406|nr:pituitary tumor-transforming gene 1 protein-interacting protein isoform X1 [Ciona intestinalis]|eukprot:XP_002128761.1 pituitary tumor-transforming gene 1 protein-interacting protein isoform X1 [Ciona intestinalis]
MNANAGLFCLFAVGLFIILCNVNYSSANTPPTPVNCSLVNDSCESCLKLNVKCMWCNKPRKCMDYPVNHILPTSADCGLADARWGVCGLNFEALIISVSVVGGLLLIAITLCLCKCCKCCCFKKDSAKYEREAQRLDRERQERAMRQDERKLDRQRKNDDIRRKYGLIKDNNRYQRFDDETA